MNNFRNNAFHVFKVTNVHDIDLAIVRKGGTGRFTPLETPYWNRDLFGLLASDAHRGVIWSHQGRQKLDMVPLINVGNFWSH